MSDTVSKQKQKQKVFPLVLDSDADRERIKDIAGHFRGSQSEVIRRLIEVCSVAVDAKNATPEQEWLLKQVDDLVKQAWER